jgi:flagellar protein FliT
VSASRVIANYELLSSLTGQMLEAAKQEDWDRLVGIEQQCSDLVAVMKPLDAEVKLDEAVRQRKNELIVRILADQDEIRKLTSARMSGLEGSMRSNRQEQRVLKAYRG